MSQLHNKTPIFDRFSPDDSLSYRFEIYQNGYHIDTVTFNNFSAAQRFFLKQYFTYDYGEKLFINDEEITFLESYEFFNASEINSREWGKRLTPTRL